MGERFREPDEGPDEPWRDIVDRILMQFGSIKERLTGESERYIEAVAGLYLNDLGLSWDELKGQEILDVGAGGAEFAQAARKRHIAVRSLDMVRGGMGGTKVVPRSVPYDIWDVRKKGRLPYPDRSYDRILARAAVAAMVGDEDAEGFRNIINDFVRVLRPGGELRFGPNPIHFHGWTDAAESALQRLWEDGKTDEYQLASARKEYDTYGWEQPADVQQARFAKFIEDDARLIHPALEVHFLLGDQHRGGMRAVNYYTLRKPGNASEGLLANP